MSAAQVKPSVLYWKLVLDQADEFNWEHVEAWRDEEDGSVHVYASERRGSKGSHVTSGHSFDLSAENAESLAAFLLA